MPKYFIFLFISTLCACSDSTINLPHVISGNEVPTEVMAAPRLVPTSPQSTNTSWPRLGDVPSKPKNFASPEQVESSMQDLRNERAAGQTLHQQLAPDLAGRP